MYNYANALVKPEYDFASCLHFMLVAAQLVYRIPTFNTLRHRFIFINVSCVFLTTKAQ